VKAETMKTLIRTALLHRAILHGVELRVYQGMNEAGKYWKMLHELRQEREQEQMETGGGNVTLQLKPHWTELTRTELIAGAAV
jgi:hypothetical protein